MNWTKIPTDLLMTRTPDNELLAIVKYQLLWAELERQPSDDVAMRYMTKKQLLIARQWVGSIESHVKRDINAFVSHRGRQKEYYKKNQTYIKNNDGQCDSQCDSQCDNQCASADKRREDEKKEMLKESGALPPSRSSLTAYYDKFYDWWNDKLRLKESELESPGHIKHFTAKSPERQRAFNQRWKETKAFLKQKGQNPTDDQIFDYMTKNVIGFNYINSPWLQGRITSDKYETPFEFNVDFVLRPSTWTKLLENYYVDKKFNIDD